LKCPRKLKTKKDPVEILDRIRLQITGETALGKIRNNPDSSPFKVLISTVLSARTKDSVTEAASQRLFEKFPNSDSLSKADPSELAKIILPVLYHNVKSKRIVEISRILEQKFSSRVPSTLAELMELPGVGRKTANCVLVYGFGRSAIPVDVHVHRVSNRIGLVRTKRPKQTEEELTRIYDEKYWLDINELFVRFGQTICKPIRPSCPACSIKKYCDYYKFEFKS
jgi:endonuclease-3